MKRTALAVLPFVLLAASACSSSGARKDSAEAAAAEASKAQGIADEELRKINLTRALAGQPPLEKIEPPSQVDEWTVFTDKETGRRLQRIPKSPSLRVENGKLRHAQLNPAMFLLDLVREDEDFYYVDAPPERKAAGKQGMDDMEVPEGLAPLVDVPEIEYEVVAPPVSRVRIRFEEKSEGLPTSGFWRSNMVVADLDGDGRPEIVAPPPRLSGSTFRIFRFDGTRWVSVEPRLESDDVQLRFGFGGVDAVDMDGDGRPDVVGVGHGEGPVVAYNLGAFAFRVAAPGLPRRMSGRAIAGGDIDGDGRMDLVAISDEPESARTEARRERTEGVAQMTGRELPEEPAPEGYKEGFDTRAFFGYEGGRFVERSAGLDQACFGYSLALAARPAGGGAPFFVSGCRYQGGRALLYEWDAAAKGFRHVGRGVVEEFSFHAGSATGTYRGFPAGFASYVKGNAPGAIQRPIRGHGVSVYYRDAEGWKSRRVVKALADQGVESAGLGVGDLNGDGLDDVVWADGSVGRVRVFFQTAAGGFEELDPELQPKFVNHSMSVRVADVDGDGRNDIVLMYEFRTTDRTRAGGLRFFRNAG